MMNVARLRVRTLSPLHVGIGAHPLGPTDVLVDADRLIRVDVEAFVRRLTLPERALFESRLCSADGLRQGHQFMAERLPMCKVGSISVGLLSRATAQALAAFRGGRQRVFRVAHTALLTGEAACFHGGHLRAALSQSAAAVRGNRALRSRPPQRRWSAFSFGATQLLQGRLDPWIACSGRMAPAAAHPLVLVSKEDWLQVHCGSDDLIIEVKVRPGASAALELHSIDELWDEQLCSQRASAQALGRQVQAMRRRRGTGSGTEADAFMRRAEQALDLLDRGAAIVTRLGMGGGRREGNTDSAAGPGTCPAAVFTAERSGRGWREVDHAPLGWVLVERAAAQ